MMARISTGVIPAAGEGKRLGYLSSIIPKCLFPLYDKPIIHHVIENMVSIGVERIIIPAYYQKSKLHEYFEYARKEIDADICLLELNKLPEGIALTMASAKKHLEEPFIAILGDDVTITDSLQPLVHLFLRKKAVAVEGIVPESSQEIIKHTCCIELERDQRIARIVEKPDNPSSSLRGCGVYVFDPEIFEFVEKTPILPPRNEVELTNTIDLVAKDGRAYGGFINGINVNVNTPEDLFQAWLAARTRVVKGKNET